MIIKHKRLLLQILKFGIVGSLAFFVDFSILFILTEFMSVHYFVSSFVSFVVSVVFNYIASALWVFTVDKTKNRGKVFVLFIVLSIAGLALNQLIMWYGVEQLNLYYMLVKILATVVVMIFNFITRKKFMEA